MFGTGTQLDLELGMGLELGGQEEIEKPVVREVWHQTSNAEKGAANLNFCITVPQTVLAVGAGEMRWRRVGGGVVWCRSGTRSVQGLIPTMTFPQPAPRSLLPPPPPPWITHSVGHPDS